MAWKIGSCAGERIAKAASTYVEAVKPDHGLIVALALTLGVVVPVERRRQEHVATLHLVLEALDRRRRAGALPR